MSVSYILFPRDHPNHSKQMDIPSTSPFTAAFEYCSEKTGERFQNPLYPLTELFTGARFRSSLAEVRRFGDKIVARAIERQQDSKSLKSENREQASYGRLLDAFMDALDDPQLVRDAALNFLSAGTAHLSAPISPKTISLTVPL